MVDDDEDCSGGIYGKKKRRNKGEVRNAVNQVRPIQLSTFTHYLDLSNFILESGLWYFRVLTICLLLVYFVKAAKCHCFDLQLCSKNVKQR